MFDSDSAMPLASTTSATVTKHHSPLTSHRPAPTLSGSLSPAIPHSCALFCSTQILNPFLFNGFRTLRQKPPRVGALLLARAPRFAEYPSPREVSRGATLSSRKK